MSEELKRRVAEEALSLLPEAGLVGLGSGSTATLFIEAVGRLVARGRKLRGVATSQKSREQAEAIGIEVLPDAGPWQVDVCVDGADEVSEDLHLMHHGVYPFAYKSANHVLETGLTIGLQPFHNGFRCASNTPGDQTGQKPIIDRRLLAGFIHTNTEPARDQRASPRWCVCLDGRDPRTKRIKLDAIG